MIISISTKAGTLLYQKEEWNTGETPFLLACFSETWHCHCALCCSCNDSEFYKWHHLTYKFAVYSKGTLDREHGNRHCVRPKVQVSRKPGERGQSRWCVSALMSLGEEWAQGFRIYCFVDEQNCSMTSVNLWVIFMENVVYVLVLFRG